MRRILMMTVLVVVGLVTAAPAAHACGSLVAANGAVNLVRTSTLVAYHDGVEHYVTSFEFAGAPESFGSVIPLPAEPTRVEKAGGWTLQRLQREVQPVIDEDFEALRAAPSAADSVEVLQQVRIDSLDVTILRGGGHAVAGWAAENGFDLTPDTPEVLEFYGDRSPYFMAAKFDARAAVAAGFRGGDGVPVHLVIPTDDPWVPLRILATGKRADAPVDADVFLLTDERPALLYGRGVAVERSERASDGLLDDLRSDERSGWVPQRAWLTYARVDTPAGAVTYDLAISADGGMPDLAAFGADPDVAVDALADLVDESTHSAAVTVAALALSLMVAAGITLALKRLSLSVR